MEKIVSGDWVEVEPLEQSGYNIQLDTFLPDVTLPELELSSVSLHCKLNKIKLTNVRMVY